MAANVSKYIQAGNIASRQSLGIQSAAIQSGSDLSKISQEAQRQKIESEIAARRASATVYKAGMEGESRVRQTQNRYNPKEAKKSPLRKAGAVAAAGLVVGAAYKSSKGDKTPKRKRYSPPEFDATSQIEDINQQIAASRERTSKLLNPSDNSNIATKPTEPSSPASSSLDVSQKAFRDTVSFAEGTWDSKAGKPMYDVTFGYQKFDTNLPHPGTVIRGEKVSSSAHGAGQFMPDTWKDIHGGKNVPMTPANQDQAIINLAKRRGYDFTKPFESQIPVVAPEWASFPNAQGRSQYNLDDGTPQPSKMSQDLIEFYRSRENFYNQKT